MPSGSLLIPDRIRKALDEGASDEEIRRIDAEMREEERQLAASMEKVPDIPNFDSLSQAQFSGTVGEKVWKGMKENPVVPCGMLATVGALLYGVTHLIRGNRDKQHLGMRMRIGFQTFTVIALCAGTLYQQRKVAQKQKAQGFASARKAANV